MQVQVQVGYISRKVDRVLRAPRIGTVLIHLEGDSAYRPISILNFADQVKILSILKGQKGITSKSGAKLIKL